MRMAGWVAVMGALWMLVASCGGDGDAGSQPRGQTGLAITASVPKPELAATVTPSLAPDAVSPAETPSASHVSTPFPFNETLVVVYEPDVQSAERFEGERCFTSGVLARAWRCSGGPLPGDPCFGPPGAIEVVCPRTPHGQDGYWLSLEEPVATGTVSPVSEAVSASQAWWVETAGGLLCGFKSGGTAPVVEGERVNFFCDDGRSGLVGLPTPGTVWTARLVPAAMFLPGTPVPVTVVELRTVWR